jgi:hypothetical protein
MTMAAQKPSNPMQRAQTPRASRTRWPPAHAPTQARCRGGCGLTGHNIVATVLQWRHISNRHGVKTRFGSSRTDRSDLPALFLFLPLVVVPLDGKKHAHTQHDHFECEQNDWHPIHDSRFPEIWLTRLFAQRTQPNPATAAQKFYASSLRDRGACAWTNRPPRVPARLQRARHVGVGALGAFRWCRATTRLATPPASTQ